MARGARILGALLLVGALGASTVARAGLFDGAGEVTAELHASDAQTRREAVDKLDALSAEAARPYLEAALGDLDLEVRARAARSIGRHRLIALAPRLETLLGGPEPSLRAAAAEALGALGQGDRAAAARFCRPLERALSDADHNVRVQVVRALGRLPPIEARAVAAPLTARLEDENTTVRAEAAEVLGALGDRRAVIPLIGRLSDPSRDVKRAALGALGALGDPGAAPAMLRLVSASQPDEVRADAVQALGRLGARAAIEPLIGMLAHPGDPLAGEAAFALGQIARATQPTPRAARDLDPHAARAAAAPASPAVATASDAATVAAPPAVANARDAAPAIAALTSALGRDETRTAAREALAVVGARAVPALLARLETASGEELDAVVELLGTLGDRRATGPLTDELASGRLLRERVVGALGAIAHRGDPRPIPTLVGLLGDPDLSVRRRAAQAIAGLTDARAESALLTAARDPDREVRLIAIGELGRLRAPHAVAALTSALTCSSGAGCDAETAAAAARALGAIGDEHASEPLLSALDRPEARLRRDAADALARLRPPAIALAPELLRRIRVGAADRRLDALAALAGVLRGRPNPNATELSLGLVEGDDTQSAEVAAHALAAMLGPCAGCNAEPAARRLERRLGRADHDPELRRSLVAALGELGVDGTRGTLTARLTRDSDPLVRAEAAWALGKKAAPDGKISPALERALADADPAVRANAAAAIYRTARTQGAVAPHSGALTRLLADPDPAVRADAALALGLDPDARPALARLGDDPDPRVRAAASSALAKRPPGAPADFVAIHVVDFDGAPLAGARYRLTLPDGSIKLGATDGRGDVREESAPRGGCALELLDGH